MREGKYICGLKKSMGCVVAEMIISMLRMPQALGIPVVPEVKTRHARFLGVRSAAVKVAGVSGRSEAVTKLMPGFWGVGASGNATRDSAKCGKELHMASDNSGVERIMVACETLRQCSRGPSVVVSPVSTAGVQRCHA